MAWPDELETLRTDLEGSDSAAEVGHSALHNAVNRLVNALQAELGTSPSGEFDTVAAFLAGLKAGTAIDALDLAKITGAGDAAGLDVGTTSGTVAAGDDARLALANTAIQAGDLAAVATSGAYGDLSGAGILTGSGSPLSVVTPDFVGQLYADAAVTTGAALWRATGATSADWTVAVGDTGARNLSAVTLDNGWTFSAGTLDSRQRIQRVGNLVTINFWINGLSATADVFYTLPVGFRPDATRRMSVPAALSSSTQEMVLQLLSTGALAILTERSGGIYAGETFPTADPWPTTLPGTAL